MENRSLVTIANHSKERILYLLEMAKEFEKKPNRRLLAEKSGCDSFLRTFHSHAVKF